MQLDDSFLNSKVMASTLKQIIMQTGWHNFGHMYYVDIKVGTIATNLVYTCLMCLLYANKAQNGGIDLPVITNPLSAIVTLWQQKLWQVSCDRSVPLNASPSMPEAIRLRTTSNSRS